MSFSEDPSGAQYAMWHDKQCAPQREIGNVRVVLTEEDATFTQKWLATMELVYQNIEEQEFDYLDERRQELPTGYPIDATTEFNERIAYVIADNGFTMGPSKLLGVKKGDRVRGNVNYFYTEDAPGTSYSSFEFFLSEVLVSLVSSAAGVAPVSEAQLLSVLFGQNHVAPQLSQFLATQLRRPERSRRDTTDMSRPHAYLVYLLYDNNFNLVPASSGARRVENPNHTSTPFDSAQEPPLSAGLEQLLTGDLSVSKDGFLHVGACPASVAAFCGYGQAWVGNGSAGKGVNFDNSCGERSRTILIWRCAVKPVR